MQNRPDLSELSSLCVLAVQVQSNIIHNCILWCQIFCEIFLNRTSACSKIYLLNW